MFHLKTIKKNRGVVYIRELRFFYGVYAIALGEVIFGIIATFINGYPSGKLLNYSYVEQWNDIMPSLMLF